jgi:hypothetical protein
MLIDLAEKRLGAVAKHRQKKVRKKLVNRFEKHLQTLANGS